MEITDIPLTETVGLPERIPLFKPDTLDVDIIKVLLIGALGLPVILNVEKPDIEIPELPLRDALGLPVILWTEVPGVDATEVSPTGTLGLSVILGVRTPDIDTTDEPLTDTLGLPVMPEVTTLGVLITDVPLTEILGLPERIPLMPETEILDVADTEVPLTDIDAEEIGETAGVLEIVLGSADKMLDADMATERLKLWGGRVPEVEDPPVGIDMNEESNALDVVDNI